MRYDIQLFINDQEIEFSTDPKLLLNYTETSLHNPTIVRNSFTKQIEIEGTSRNNDIFGHIWRLDRYQYYGGGGAAFNPIQKADFKLFVGGELFEKGYVKLNSIKEANNSIKYNITLFGSLGDFFYSIMYDGDTKKTLASLTYSTDDRPGPDLDFNINKDTVNEAWGQLTGTGSGVPKDKWRVINFCPAYNGIPEDFDSEHILINNNGLNRSIFENSRTEGSDTYTPILGGAQSTKGYSLGELSEPLTEWESYDLRSYHQRPCISMKRVIEACCQPENNGGYKVELDPHFFNNQNPYYQDAWLTLPMLKSLDHTGNETENVTGATVQKSDGLWNVNFNTSTLSSINNVKMKVGLTFTPNASTSASKLYSARHYYSRTTITLQPWTFVKKWDFTGGIVVQLQGFDNAGNAVARSKAYLLGTEKYLPNSTNPLWTGFDADSFEYVAGYWKKIDGTFRFVDFNDNPIEIEFTFRADSDFTGLKFAATVYTGSDVRYAFQGQPYYTSENNLGNISLYTSTNYNTTGNSRDSDVFALDRVQGSLNLTVNSLDAIATDYQGLFSNTYITKEMLLGGESDKSPADYFIGYCKLFGLYFYIDSAEEAEDTEKYPSGVIHIMDRDTFYTDEVANLSEMIDYSRNLTITPATAEAKWYRFDLEQAQSQANDDYLGLYKQNYGAQLVNTNYNFDSNTTDLYTGNAFRGGLMVREKDKYYKQPVDGIPNYTFNGLTYYLYRPDGNEYSSVEIAQDVSTTNTWKNLNTVGLDYYDCFPKLQFHTEENTPSDGSDVLVFFKGTVTTDGEGGKTNYWLTDDVPEMVTLNEAEACWILTNSEYDGNNQRIAYKINYLPFFTRDIILGGQEGNIVHSWNFGHPQVIFVPNNFTTYGDSIYDKCWKNYITDFYDVNSRKLNCYVRAEMDGRPWPFWLRRFYWFDNAIWRLNTIKDLNMCSFEPTQMEFIKVQDTENYKLDQILYGGNAFLSFNSDTISYQGGTMTGKVNIQSGGFWQFADYFSSTDALGNVITYRTEDYITPTSGQGVETMFSMTVPANNGNVSRVFNLCFEYDEHTYCGSFTQGTNGAGAIIITPSAQTVSHSATATSFNVVFENIVMNTVTLYDNADWLEASLNGNTLNVTLSANTGDSGRTAVIWVTGDDLLDNQIMVIATVNQNGQGIDVTPNVRSFDWNESDGTKEFTITTEGNWTITLEEE